MLEEMPSSDVDKLAEILARLFEGGDPRCDRFTPTIPCRGLLFPVHYHLCEEWFEAVRAAALRVHREDTFWFGWADGRPGGGLHGILLPLSFEAYVENSGQPLQSFLISPSGVWAIRATDEQVALIGGTEAFLESVYERIGVPASEHLRRFTDYLSDASEIRARGEALINQVA